MRQHGTTGRDGGAGTTGAAEVECGKGSPRSAPALKGMAKGRGRHERRGTQMGMPLGIAGECAGVHGGGRFRHARHTHGAKPGLQRRHALMEWCRRW